MYSERDQTNLLFRELIERDAAYDPKITLLREVMRAAEQEIASDPEYRKDIRKSPTFDQLVAEWEFTESLVEMSGKIYIEDPDFAGGVPEEWGDARSDVYGTWFNVPKTQFVSVGPYPVEDTTRTDSNDEDEDRPEDDKSSAPFRLGYGMILPEDADAESSEEIVAFYALPEDVTTDFLRPSLTAVDYRLHERYPDELAQIDAAIPVGSSNITRSIHKLREVLPTLTIKDPDEVIWLSEYIWNRLGTDRQWPYVALLDKLVVLEDVANEPEQIILHEPLEQCAYISGIALTQDDEIAGLGGVVTFDLAAGLDSEKEIEAKLYAPLESVQSIRSLRPRRSLSEQIKAVRIEKLRAHIHKSIAETAFSMGESGDENDAAELELDELPHLHRETLYKRLSKKNSMLREVIKQTAEARKHLYDDKTSAEKDCITLVEQIAQKFEEAELYGEILSAAGETVLRPNIEHEINERGAELRFLSEPLFVNGGQLDTFKGALLSVIPRLEGIPSSDDEQQMQYRINPMLLLDDSTGISMNGANDAFSAIVMRRTHAPIADGITELKHIQFERLHEHFETYKELKQRDDLPSIELVQILQKLDRALYHETSTGFTTLRHTKQFHAVADKITALEMDDLAIDAFAQLFTEGQALTVGGIESTAEGDLPAMVSGEFAGIVRDSPYTDRERLSIVLRIGSAQRYLPVDAIETFLF